MSLSGYKPKEPPAPTNPSSGGIARGKGWQERRAQRSPVEPQTKRPETAVPGSERAAGARERDRCVRLH